MMKKRIAIVMILLCGSFFLPTTANASSTKCPPHLVSRNNPQNSTTTTSHEYIYGTVVEEDGVEDYWYKDCTITITIDKCEMDCKKCGMHLEQQGIGEKITHSK